MEYKFEMGQGKLRVVVPKELDHHLATQLKEEADLLIETYHVKTLIFDFTNTEFMDSSGIGVLIGRSFSGGQVVATNLSPRVEQIFRISGLQRLITVVPSDQENQKSEV